MAKRPAPAPTLRDPQALRALADTQPVDAHSGVLARCIDHYAWLVVSLYAMPYSAEPVMARYGIRSSTELDELHRLWQQRLDRDPELRARFCALRLHAAKSWSPAAA